MDSFDASYFIGRVVLPCFNFTVPEKRQWHVIEMLSAIRSFAGFSSSSPAERAGLSHVSKTHNTPSSTQCSRPATSRPNTAENRPVEQTGLGHTQQTSCAPFPTQGSRQAASQPSTARKKSEEQATDTIDYAAEANVKNQNGNIVQTNPWDSQTILALGTSRSLCFMRYDT